MRKIAVRVKDKASTIKIGFTQFISRHRYVSGITVIELVLILVKNLALYIEYIEGGKSLKNKLYTRYTQE